MLSRRFWIAMSVWIGVFCSVSSQAQEGWWLDDVGNVGAPGTSTYDSVAGSFLLSGTGGGIGTGADAFSYLYQVLTGDGEIIVRVASVQSADPNGRAGLMLRENLTGTSINASLLVSAGGQILWQNRATPGSPTQTSASAAATGTVWLKLTRVGSAISAAWSSGEGWTSLGTSTVNFGSRIFIGMAAAGAGVNGCSATFQHVRMLWRDQDIGVVGLAGSSAFAGASGSYTVMGAGADIGGTADAFRYVYQTLRGDGQIVARVASVQNTNASAKAGVMIRETLAAGSNMALMAVTPSSGAQFVYRTAAGGQTKTTSAAGVAAPRWVKLVRSGSTLNGYHSPDGVAWTLVKSQSITMASTVYIGLAVTSRSTAALCTSTFDGVSVIQPWLDEDQGTVGLAGRVAYAEANGSYAVSGAGAAIGGTVDNFHFVHQALNGDGQIVVRLGAQQNTAAGARAGVMIRSALTNNAQNVALLATPGSGLLFQARSVAGGATTATPIPGIAAPVWLKLMRVGNVFSAFRSTDGMTWLAAGSQTIALPAASFIGFAVCSGNTTALSRADFDSVLVGGVDTDNDNLPDSYETAQFGNLSQTAAGDFDHDGLSNLDEYEDNSSPSDYYNGTTANLSKISGDDQTGTPGGFLPQPLVVEVRNSAGQLLIDAPVTFTVNQGGGLLSLAPSGSPLAATQATLTNAAGRAAIYYQQPSGSGVSSVIRASGGAAQVDFTASTTGTVATPTLSPDGGTFATRRMVAATSSTTGAVIRYSLTGTDPTEQDPSVANGGTILVPATATLKVKAFKTGWTASGTKSASFVMTGAVAGSYSGTLALRIDGTVAAWGLNFAGELGNGSYDPEVLPWTNPPTYTQGQLTAGPVLGLSGMVALAARNTSSLGLKGDGTVWGWGSNGYGGIGASTTAKVLTPQMVPNLAGVAAISINVWHSVLLKVDGTVWVMGSPSATAFSPVPAQVAGLSGVKAVAAGNNHSMALKADGTVWSWGGGTAGQLGNARTRDSATPVQASGLTGVIAIAAGEFFSLAVKSDGTVWAWGSNAYAQLGDGTQTSRSSPVRVTGLTGVTAIATGLHHSLALKADGTAWHWGRNQYGQSMSGYNNLVMLTPVQVGITSGDIAAIGAGDNHSEVIRRDGTVWGGGLNLYGALGTGVRYNVEYFPRNAVNINVLAQVDAPVFAPQPQSPDGLSRPVIITCAMPGATIRYTTSGQDPGLSDPSIASGGTVAVPLPGTLKARAWFPNMAPSTVTSASYDGDRDGDGLSDNYELSIGTNPGKRDSDGDGTDDNVELANGTDPRVNNGFNDPDHDGLTTAEEAILGTDPNVNNLPGGGSGVLRLHTPLEAY
jgi:alpha-tubulin suppressor-like RCC1 family protein/regulation of enolase protein 1 (concanavalin A-like superfamily)